MTIVTTPNIYRSPKSNSGTAIGFPLTTVV
jgi:hypothetical protein